MLHHSVFDKDDPFVACYDRYAGEVSTLHTATDVGTRQSALENVRMSRESLNSHLLKGRRIVCIVSPDGTQIYCKIRLTTPFGKVVQKLTGWLDIPCEHLKLTYKGYSVGGHDSLTSMSLWTPDMCSELTFDLVIDEDGTEAVPP